MNDSFPAFKRLPLELRRIIWKLCLPCRIAEEDIVYFLLDGNESRQACWTRRTTYLNAQPPVIAFVNSESRQVALEEGRRSKPNESTSLESIWVQPRRDVLHLNWMRLRYLYHGDIYVVPSPISLFLLRAETLRMQPSVIAEIIHSFSLKALLDDPESSDATDSPRSTRYGIHNTSDVSDIAGCTKLEGKCDDIQRRVKEVEHRLRVAQTRLNVTMAAVSLHIPKDAALRSGLFGLLGDAPVQMVDVGDHVALREFQTLFRQHALDKEPALQTLFDLFTSSRFGTAVETWKRQAEWCILLEMWRHAKTDLAPNPGSAWIPYLPDDNPFSMSQYVPNERHPWVKEARRKMPRLRPRIMKLYRKKLGYPSFARIGVLIGEAGNGTLTLAQIIEGPESAPSTILGLIAGAGARSIISKEDTLMEPSKARMALKGWRFGQVSAGF
ncbi:hypothetical protein PISL3812_06039 [Talaromyces islandicus]|uniref:2EXR domain-containing protein n=1 Tax=Talaromyces islandicus TaxID=28573 RepID=A0A0U1M0B2_TALIS|nr:hypothetical protein PISL3812_06039 [Talaromyces islandicus]